MNKSDIQNSHLLPFYDKYNEAIFVSGKGCYLYDDSGNRYLDFASGISVNALGHCHPLVVSALKDQAEKLWHISGIHWHDQIIECVNTIISGTFADMVYFMNSGAEAIETGIKMVRRYFYSIGQDEKDEIICFDKSFHGRTLTCLAAQNIYTEGFGPVPGGFKHATFNDIASVESLITDKTAAILIEPIQAEGGVRVADIEFMKGLDIIRKKYNIALIFDEIQCGMGRTGHLYTYMFYGVEPDVLTSAKGIGNGFPVSCIMVNKKIGSCASPGIHGSTYGANPLACRVVNTVFKIISDSKFLTSVKEHGSILMNELNNLKLKYPHIIDSIHGMGLMIGIRLKDGYQDKILVSELRKNHMLTIIAYGNMVRLLPPLIIDRTHIDEAIGDLIKVFDTW